MDDFDVVLVGSGGNSDDWIGIGSEYGNWRNWVISELMVCLCNSLGIGMLVL